MASECEDVKERGRGGLQRDWMMILMMMDGSQNQPCCLHDPDGSREGKNRSIRISGREGGSAAGRQGWWWGR